MKILTICIVYLLTISTGCAVEESVSSYRQSLDENTVWVFAQFNVPDKDGIEDFFYYGRVNKQLYEAILDGTNKDKFILLRDVRYWDLEDQIQKYESNADTGNIIFRVEDIMRLILQKGDPYILERENQTEEPVAE